MARPLLLSTATLREAGWGVQGFVNPWCHAALDTAITSWLREHENSRSRYFRGFCQYVLEGPLLSLDPIDRGPSDPPSSCTSRHSFSGSPIPDYSPHYKRHFFSLYSKAASERRKFRNLKAVTTLSTTFAELVGLPIISPEINGVCGTAGPNFDYTCTYFSGIEMKCFGDCTGFTVKRIKVKGQFIKCDYQSEARFCPGH
ncbi:uncharacterized protein LOC117182940 [Belonocnema kinseyi]|uniref:uncharacterized protein LOC117182940 n=1 Tax=Belonocnema kinseyi TaxID=2817044 RepID=UPI00143D3EDB|nr:uncharacterized protein LOC117182940 [Belonocnema kinseyi]